jgi:dihydroorotase
MSETLVIRGGTVIHADRAQRHDVLIRDGKIAEVAPTIAVPAGALLIDATGAWVGPGFVDLHTHMREPGREGAETVESASRAGAMGGYSAVVAMPNTEPAIDNVVVATYVLHQGERAVIDVAVAGAITIGRRGTHLAAMGELAQLGVRLFTDDGTGVQDPSLMRRAMTYAAPLGVRLAQHCEDELLAANGVMNEGALSSKLGLSGRAALAEELMVMRDIELVRLTNCPLHFLHLSTARSVALVASARSEGLAVTCEVAPHHFTLDESSCTQYDATFKVHPPLRTQRDVTELRDALRDGRVDAVATDHAPHEAQLKDLPFDEAPAGMLGLEHAASLTLEVLGPDNPVRLFQLLSRAPAAIAQLRASDHPVRQSAHGGDIAVGEDANVVIFDPSATRRVDRNTLQSRSTNTPYHDRDLLGATRALVVRGTAVVLEGALR